MAGDSDQLDISPEKVPGSRLRDHTGDPTSEQDDWFIAAPTEIGPVRTAHTSLKVDQHPRTILNRVLLCVAVAVVIDVIAELASPYFAKPNGPSAVRILGVIVAVCGALIAWFSTRFKHHVSYIGALGMARYTVVGSRENPPRVEFFLFNYAAELRTGETRHFHNGIYTGTHYSFIWSDANGRNVFKLVGQYSSKAGTPPIKDKYWFAKAGELAWYDYLFNAKAEELARQGYLQFNLTKQDYVRVGPGFFEFGMKGEAARVTPPEIASLSLAQGQFMIKTHDARWFSSRGKFSFSYANMANARLFLIAIERLLGYKFS